MTPKRSSFLAAALAAAAVLVPAAGASAAPGDLDSSFGGDGRLTLDLGAIDTAQAVAYQPDGKVLVAGEARTGLTADFVVLRLNADGSPDGTFGGDGRAEVDFGAFDRATALALQPDGAVVVAGATDIDSSPAHGNFSIGVARLDARGRLDNGFSGDGRQVVDFGAQDLAADVAIQPDGAIVVAGDIQTATNRDFIWVRLERDGDPDPTFDDDGRARLDGGASESPASVAVAGDGKIVTAGHTTANGAAPRDFAFARLTAGGKPDASFSGDGFTQVAVGEPADDTAAGVAVLPDGGIVAGGTTGTSATSADFAAVRLTAAGELDPSFGGDGRATIDGGRVEVGQDAALTADGGLAVAGATIESGAFGDFAIAEFRPDGSPDRRLDGDGAAFVDFGGPEVANALAVKEGQLIAAGTAKRQAAGAAADDVVIAALRLPRAGDPFPADAPPEQAPAGPAPGGGQAPPPAAGDNTAPVLERLKLKPARFRARRGTRGSFTLTEPARVTLTIQRKRGRRLVKAGTIKLAKAKPGANRFALRKIGRRRLAPGSYRLTATAVDAAGNKSRSARLKFRVR